MFKRLKKWTESHKTLFALIVTLFFIISQIPFLVNHEIWNDEATSWQLSQEITPTNFYEINSAEPHPVLWQLVLAPFSKLNFPIITLNIISLAFVAAAVFVIFRFSKVKFFTKFIFLFSAAFFYFLPVISRDYSMVPLAIALICVAYESRHKKPLLYGLAVTFLTQTHFLMYGLAAALAVGFVIEETIEKKTDVKKLLKGICCFVLPILISLALVAPIVVNSFNNQAIMTGKVFEKTPENYRDEFLPNVILNYCGYYNSFSEVFVPIVLILIALAFFIRDQKTFLYLLSGVGFWFFVMGNIYKGYDMLAPKVALLIVMLFGIIWLNNIEDTGENNKIEKFLIKHCELLKFAIVKITKNWYVVFSIILIIPSIFYTFSYAKDDLSRPFSNAKELADFINTRIEPGSVIIEGEPASVLYSAVNSYIENDVTIYNAIINRVENKMDYLKYDNETVGLFMDYEAKSKDELKKLFDELSEKYEHVYYYSSVLSCSSDPDLIELMENYDEIGKFNDKIYLDVAYARTAFYKIK